MGRGKMASSGIVGSWFPTGYYGHFRSKTRQDFLCEYRQLAKPQPPQRFLNRAMQPSSKHTFSHHDNREAFRNDAALFGQGLGKKRDAAKMYTFDPDFCTWMPLREEIQRSRPLESTYRVDFSRTGKEQILVKRPKTSFDGQSGITSYRYAHGVYAPNREIITAMAEPALNLSTTQRAQTAKLPVTPCRETVASCLSWYRPPVPKATPITDFTQNTKASQIQHVPVPPSTAPPAMEHIPAPPPGPPPQPAVQTVAE